MDKMLIRSQRSTSRRIFSSAKNLLSPQHPAKNIRQFSTNKPSHQLLSTSPPRRSRLSFAARLGRVKILIPDVLKNYPNFQPIPLQDDYSNIHYVSQGPSAEAARNFFNPSGILKSVGSDNSGNGNYGNGSGNGNNGNNHDDNRGRNRNEKNTNNDTNPDSSKESFNLFQGMLPFREISSSYARVSTGLLGVFLTLPLLFGVRNDSEENNKSDADSDDEDAKFAKSIDDKINDKSLSKGERLLLKRLNSVARPVNRQNSAGRNRDNGTRSERKFFTSGSNNSNNIALNEEISTPNTSAYAIEYDNFRSRAEDDKVMRESRLDLKGLYNKEDYDYTVDNPGAEDLASLVILHEDDYSVWPWVWAGPNENQQHHVICLDADALFFPANSKKNRTREDVRNANYREEGLQDFIELREKQQGALRRIIETYNGCDVRGQANFLVVFTGDCGWKHKVKRKNSGLTDGTGIGSGIKGDVVTEMSFQLPKEWREFFEKNQLGLIWSDIQLLDHSNKIMMLQDERIIVYDSLHLMY